MNNSEEIKQFKIDFKKNRFHLHGKANIDLLADYIEKILASQNKELREKIEGIRININYKSNTHVSVDKTYNQALSDVLSLLKFDGDIDATHKSTEEKHYSCMLMLMKRDLGCCKCENHECRVWEEK